MIKHIKIISKTFFIYLVMVLMVFWTINMPISEILPSASAAGGIEVMYTDDGGSTPDVHLNSTSTPESILKINAYETQSGTNTLNSITIQVEEDMNCSGSTCTESPFAITDLSSITATASSGISLWQDDGDGTFETNEDTLLSDINTASAWQQVTVSNPWGGSYTVWQTTFSSLNLSLPTSYNGLVLFVSAMAGANIDASPLHKFHFIIPQNGIDVSAESGATISDFPSEEGGRMFSPVVLGTEGSGAGMQFGAPFVISEIQTSGGNTNDEFIEIYNRTSDPIEFMGVQIVYAPANATSLPGDWTASTTLNGTIPGNGYFLVGKNGGYDGATSTNDTYTEFSMSETGGFVALYHPEYGIIDMVGYGDLTTPSLAEGASPASAPSAHGSIERKARPESTPSTMIGGVDALKGNGEDTNNNGSDFILRLASDLSDPQNSSGATETSEIQLADRGVVINEVLYNTSSGSGWVELFNSHPTDSKSIENFVLEIATSTTQSLTLPSVNMPAGTFTLVYWNNTGSNDLDASDGMATVYSGTKADMSTYGGDITLKNESSVIVDYIQYGGPGKAGSSAAVSARKWTTGDFISNSDYNESIARKGTEGDDYNTSEDWMYLASPSPGYPNVGGDTTDPTSVTNVTLIDSDTSNYGLDGNDVRVAWVPATTYDSSFDRYEIYLLTASTSLDTALHDPYATIYGQYMYESGTASTSYTFTGFSDFNMKYDSAGNDLINGGSYKAYIIAFDFSGNKSSAISSAAATLTSEAGGSDTNPPMIDHAPVWQARVSSDLYFYARMGDDRELSSGELAYKIDDGAWGTATSTCSVPAMAGESGLRVCSISWDGGWDADTTLTYYLIAKDTSNNYKYLGMYPTDSEVEAKGNAVSIDFIATAIWDDAGSDLDLTGVVYDQSGNPLEDNFMYIEGLSVQAATTTVDGLFNFADNTMPEGWQFIRSIKSGYMDSTRDAVRGTTMLDFYMQEGFMSHSAGGSSGGNGIAWTAPMDGMMMAPTTISCTNDCLSDSISPSDLPIIVDFFNQMNSSTIDDPDASNADSNIYLTSDGVTKISDIKVRYNSSNNEARIYSSTALSPNTSYTVVITPDTKDINGNPIESNRNSGNYEFSFTTMPDGSAMWDGGYDNFGMGGMMMPPYVVGTNPAPGSFDVPRGAVLTVELSEPMDATSISNNVKLYKIIDANSWTSTEVTSNVSVSLDNATKKIATISHDTLDANVSGNGWYEVKIMGGAKSQLGVWMGDPSQCSSDPDTCLAQTEHYSSNFQVATTEDSTAPTVVGTYPTNNDGINNVNLVDVALPSIEVGFSEAMNPSTINSQTVTLKKGTTNISGTLNYDSMSNSAKFSPSTALTSASVYTLTITTGVTDLSGNALAANAVISFKTGSSDSVSPEVMFANGDDYQVALTFSEPMNAAGKTDTTNWAYSVLNPENYYINSLSVDSSCGTPGSWSCSPSLVAPYNTADGNQVSGISNINISYDAPSQTVIIEGLDMCGDDAFSSCAAQQFQVFVDNVKDRSGNQISDTGNRAGDGSHLNASRSFIQNSAETYGMLGPGSSMMMGSMDSTGGPGMDMDKMGMFEAGAMPMNTMAGQSSGYFIDIPVTKALQDGMQIILTFPTGFNVSNISKDQYSPVNNDMNEWGGGTVTFDSSYGVGGVASTSNNIITAKLDISTSSTNMLNTVAGPDGFIDFLHFDLKGIINSSIPKDFGTSGYTVDIKTKSSDGALLENIQTMPLFITEGGSDSLTVVVNSGNAGQNSGTMSIYLGSPMTGPMEAETSTFNSGFATSTFSNIISGQYMIFTDPFISIGGTNYLGKPMPEPTTVSGDTNKTITLEQEGAGSGKAAVAVYLTGDYSTGGTADDVDIFANSPSGFRVKTLTNVGSSNPNTTLYLTEGDWMMGVGPAMPKGPMAGSPTMPDWMEPQMISIVVGIEDATGRNLDPDGNTTDATNGNQEPVRLSMSNTDNFNVNDVVTFATGAASATTTITSLSPNSSITVTPQGNWTTLPAADDTVTSVRESSNINNDSTVLFDISTQSLKNIKGYVVDDSGNAIANTEIYAYRPQGFGGGHTTTDTNGKFTLKIGTVGVWTVGAFKPGMPDAREKSLDVRTNDSNTDGNTTADLYLNGSLISDANNDNTGTNPLRLKLKRPGYTISGKVLNTSGVAVPYASVWAYQPSGLGHADTMTDSSGNYILYVDAGTWRIEADAPGVGWMQYSPDVTVTTASQSNINLRPDSSATYYNISGTITIDGVAQTYMPIRAVEFDSSGNYLGKEYGGSTDSNGQYNITAPEGIYRVDIWTPTYGEVELNYDQYSETPANLNLNAATTTADIIIASADIQSISIGFLNGLSTQTGYLHVEEVEFTGDYPQPTGYEYFTQISDLSATSTIKLKGGTGANPKYYFFDLDVPGAGFFIPTDESRTALSNDKDCIKVNDATRNVYFSLPDSSTGMITVSGTITDGSDPIEEAWVWLDNPNSHFHMGTESASNGTFSLTAPKLNSGNYKLGADKPGYMSSAPTNIDGTSDSTGNTIILTTNTLTISGNVYADANSDGSFDTGEEISNAWVWAEETTTGQMTHSPADATGAYELGIANGTWQIYANADGYTEGPYKENDIKTSLTVSGSSPASKNIALSANSNWTQKTKTAPITPSSGGTIDDTAASSTGVKITVPPNAMGSDNSSGNISIQETGSVSKTTSAEPLGSIGKIIAATNNSGNAITNLDDNIDVEIVYYKQDLDDMNIVDYSKLKNLNLSYWDNSLNNWVNLPTRRAAYYKLTSGATDWTLQTATGTQTSFEVFIDTLVEGAPSYYDYKLVFTAQTDHLTVFSATQPRDSLYPSAPTGLAQTSGNGSLVGLSWTAVTTNSDATAISDLLGYEIYRSTDNTTYTQLNTSDITATTYSDTSASSWTSYYYKITAADDGGNETSLASSTALQVCSNSSVSNGSVSASCTITCDSGYTRSGNSCVQQSTSGGGSYLSPGFTSGTTPADETTADDADTENESSTVSDVVEEVANTVAEVVDTTTTKAQEYAQKIVTIASEAAEVVKAQIGSFLNKFGYKRQIQEEQKTIQDYIAELKAGIQGVTPNMEYSMTSFITYGTPTTLHLGSGERAGVINSYKSAFGKLPSTEAEWNDVIKIANGRWPSETNEKTETNAEAAFRKIYLRSPDRSNPHDDAAVTIIAYGLRPADRNLDSEKVAIKSFKAIYGYYPKSATAWDIVRAIAYSGATR